MKVLVGALVGTLAAGVALPVVGFVLGGLGRAAPCHSAPDFMSGAIFGMFAFTYILFVPACVGGAIIGGIIGAVLEARRIGTRGEATEAGGVSWPRFSLKDMFMATSLVSVGLAGIFGVDRYVVPDTNAMYALVRIATFLGSCSLIGAGLMAPFHRKRLGALMGPLAGAFFYVAMVLMIAHQVRS
jgi:hypothetical protein